VVECFCADDSNPYTRIPLILAKKRRLPTVACHHGALDSRLAFKRSHADVYLVKSEMERDYAVRICRISPRQVVVEAPVGRRTAQTSANMNGDPGFLAFFTEAYHSAGFREEEIYRELVPELLKAGSALGLDVVIKLHPFDSVKKVRHYLRSILPDPVQSHIHLWSGVMSEDRWRRTRVAVTGQSSVAMDSQSRGIPTFLCEWLRDPLSGYQKQFASFGIGRPLRSAAEIGRLPGLLTDFFGSMASRSRTAIQEIEIDLHAPIATRAATGA
jgi:hypothetical protein